MDLSELEFRVDNFIANRASKEELYNLLLLCMGNKTTESLNLVVKLAESDYGGFTYNYELKYPSVVVALFWAEKGIEKISDMAISKGKSKDINIVTEVLSLVIRGKLNNITTIDRETKVFKFFFNEIEKFNDKDLKSKAKECLIRILVNVDNNITLPIKVFNSLF